MKYNLSNIARRANALTRTMNQSAAWKMAWAEEKLNTAEKVLFVLKMKDRMDAADFTQSRELNAEIAALRQSTAALKIVEAPRTDALANYQADKAAKAKAIFLEALRREDYTVSNMILSACGPVVNETYERYFGEQLLAA